MKILRNILAATLIASVSPMAVIAGQEPPPQTSPQVQRPAGGQGQRGRGQGLAPARPGMPIQQLQAMFDAYALVQAQKALRLTDEQYQRFFTRMNRLQDVRRRHIRQRNQLLNELRRKWRPETDEAELVTLTKQLDEIETTYDSEQRAARRAIDEVLTPRQVAFFRFFEEDMERQKIDFITRSR
jgi:Spy/CpxP family protein refolding chaperone